MDEESIIYCLKCKRLKAEAGLWIEVEAATISILSERLISGYCGACADELYDEFDICQAYQSL